MFPISPIYTRIIDHIKPTGNNGSQRVKGGETRGVGRKRGRAKGRQNDVYASGPQTPQQLETRL